MAAANARHRKFDQWIARVWSNSPEVMIGAYSPLGGVRHHIDAIKKYSSLRLELAPPDELVRDLDSGFVELFAEFKPDGVEVIHSHVSPWFIKWCRERRKSGVRWIHTYHLNYFPEHSKGELLPWQREINDALLNVACHADVRISVARWQQEVLLKTHQITTLYLPNGVDVALCEQADASRFRIKVGGEPFVLFAGRNEPVKNPADFVRLAHRLPKWKFVMVGHGLSRARFVMNGALSSGESIRSRAGVDLEAQDAIAACSALVVTSKREGLPTLVLEALAQRKPVVVPDEAGCMEAIGDGEFGFIYRQGDMEDLVEKTEVALGDKERCLRGWERVLAEYDWRVVGPKLDGIYRGQGVSE